MARRTTRGLDKAAQWRRNFEAQAQSGLSIRGWCRQHQINESAFYRWRQELAQPDGEHNRPRRRNFQRSPSANRGGQRTQAFERLRQGALTTERNRRGIQPKATKASFVPVHVTDGAMPDGDPKIEIVLADGRCVRITGTVDSQALSDVLDVLEHRAC